jgi:hypothetical protein
MRGFGQPLTTVRFLRLECHSAGLNAFQNGFAYRVDFVFHGVSSLC